MPELVRIFCICGNELEESGAVCQMCGVDSGSIAFDPELPKSKYPRQKAHPNTCECDKCETLSSDRRELDFDD